MEPAPYNNQGAVLMLIVDGWIVDGWIWRPQSLSGTKIGIPMCAGQLGSGSNDV
jgi:hypothetical protein